LATWIAAIEKARRGTRIEMPQQVRFHWRSVKKDGGTAYIHEKVNHDHVSLHDSESGHDEIVIMINGVDFRKKVFSVLGFSTSP
jgi:predicted aspartyl protease